MVKDNLDETIRKKLSEDGFELLVEKVVSSIEQKTAKIFDKDNILDRILSELEKKQINIQQIANLNDKFDDLTDEIKNNNKFLEELSERVVVLEKNSSSYVTVESCNSFHDKIYSKAWTLSYPIILGLIVYALTKIFGDFW